MVNLMPLKKALVVVFFAAVCLAAYYDGSSPAPCTPDQLSVLTAQNEALKAQVKELQLRNGYLEQFAMPGLPQVLQERYQAEKKAQEALDKSMKDAASAAKEEKGEKK